jgi:hypothetical protein
LRNMNRTTTIVVALIAAAGLSTMTYTIPEQRALAWGGFGGWGGCGGFGGCGFGCGGWGGCGGFGGCGFGWGGCGGGFFDGCGFGWGGCGGGFFDGCGFGCGGFFVHKHIIQTISQTNTCSNPSAHTPFPPAPPAPQPQPPGKIGSKGGNGGSGGAGGSGGQGGQGGTSISTNTSTNIDQKANGGNSNGGHAGNASGGDARTLGNSDDQKASWAVPMDGGVNQDHNQQDKQVVCLNTAVNTAGHGFDRNGLGSDNLGQSDVPDNLLR